MAAGLGKFVAGARKFKDLHVQTGGREIPDLGAVDDAPREIAAPELLEHQKKRA